ncbi:unnamed protein product [marine sediment metagenome]|uniref:Uncharacterized protein n=1 Tax=marine sediment metagenome TaxID=412755 RepID=X0VKA7_9ZZZZ
MKSIFSIPKNEVGRIHYLVKKHNLRWVPGYPWEGQCQITGDVHDMNRFDAEREEIESYDKPSREEKPWWKRLFGGK